MDIIADQNGLKKLPIQSLNDQILFTLPSGDPSK